MGCVSGKDAVVQDSCTCISGDHGDWTGKSVSYRRMYLSIINQSIALYGAVIDKGRVD